jgi:transcriptional regulator with XRE-family HTH domain
MHIGKNIERICKLTGIKQADLAKRLNTNQQEISRIVSKEEIKDELLERIAKAIGFPKEVIKAFSDEKLINSMNQLDGTVIAQYINPIEKIVELYEKQLIEKDKRIEQYEKQLKNKR